MTEAARERGDLSTMMRVVGYQICVESAGVGFEAFDRAFLQSVGQHNCECVVTLGQCLQCRLLVANAESSAALRSKPEGQFLPFPDDNSGWCHPVGTPLSFTTIRNPVRLVPTSSQS